MAMAPAPAEVPVRAPGGLTDLEAERRLAEHQPPSPVASRRPDSHGTHSEGDDDHGDAHVRARTPRSRR